MGTIPRDCTREKPRAAVFFDLENLVHSERQLGDWDGALTVVREAVTRIRLEAIPVVMVAVCDPSLAQQMAFPLSALGIRTFKVVAGKDGADRALIERLHHDTPNSCELVVVVSGDHIFASAVRELRLRGKRVEVFSRQGLISATLYRAADDYTDVTSSDSFPLPAA